MLLTLYHFSFTASNKMFDATDKICVACELRHQTATIQKSNEWWLFI